MGRRRLAAVAAHAHHPHVRIELAQSAEGGRTGVGLAGINERVRELGGELTIRSTAQGTTLRVTLAFAAPH
jgi:signal transduction histidine kinase